MIVNTEICNDEPVDVYFPWTMAMGEGQLHCEKYFGNMTIIRDLKTWETLKAVINKNWDIADYYRLNGLVMPSQEVLLSKNITDEVDFWTGFSDENIEGHFVDIIEGRNLTDYSIFGTGEPNGNRIENCLEIMTSQHWNDENCGSGSTFFCRLRQPPKFQMRGEFSAFVFWYKKKALGLNESQFYTLYSSFNIIIFVVINH